MPTVIDSLIISLGIDPKEYKKGEKEVAESDKRLRANAAKTGKDLEQSGKQAAQFFGNIRKEIIGIGAALLSVRAISGFVKEITLADVSTGRLAGNIGMAVEDLSAFEKLIKKSGGSAQELQGDLRGLNNALQNQANGFANLPESMWLGMAKAGVDAGKFVDPAIALKEKSLMLADAISRQPATQQLAFGGMFGLSDATTRMLAVGRDKLSEELEAQKKWDVAHKEDADAAQKRLEASLKVQQALEDAFRTALTNLVPALNWLASSLDTLNGYFGKEKTQARANAAAAEERARAAGASETGALSGPGSSNGPGRPAQAPNGVIRIAPGAADRALGGDPRTALTDEYTRQTERDFKEASDELKRTTDPKARAVLQEEISRLNRQLTDKAMIKQVIDERMRYDAASTAAAGAGAASAAANQTTNVRIDSINVQTQAKDAAGIGSAIGAATSRGITAAQANTGMTQ